MYQGSDWSGERSAQLFELVCGIGDNTYQAEFITKTSD